jgi:hypothetical protein
MEYTPTLLLQVLFAVSMTLLVVRLNLRFSLPAETETSSAEAMYRDYEARLAPHLAELDPDSSGKLALVFSLFRSGQYERTIAACDDALGRFDKSSLPIDKALAIVSEQLEFMKNSLDSPDVYTVFSDTEQVYLAFPSGNGDSGDGPEVVLDNALVLIYAAASVIPEEKSGLDKSDFDVLLHLIAPNLSQAGKTE